MTGTFRPEPEASAELEDAALWYVALAQIAEWPQIGRRVIGVSNDLPARRVPVRRFPYHIVYLPWEGTLRILAFAHDRREPGYWLSRIRK